MMDGQNTANSGNVVNLPERGRNPDRRQMHAMQVYDPRPGIISKLLNFLSDLFWAVAKSAGKSALIGVAVETLDKVLPDKSKGWDRHTTGTGSSMLFGQNNQQTPHHHTNTGYSGYGYSQPYGGYNSGPDPFSSRG